MNIEDVILVNEADEELGTMEKMEAHRKALLHRAFSVFIFNSRGEMLLQQRAMNKYHSGGLWTNACCSHPRPGETVEGAAIRRTKEELGFYPQLKKAFTFIYRADFDNGLTEHEYDHVFIGQYDGTLKPDPEEISDCCYKKLEDIRENIETHPGMYTEWFKIAFHEVERHLQITDYGLRITNSNE
jgi:isopentenyl-diphosphate Delta-isomerase